MYFLFTGRWSITGGGGLMTEGGRAYTSEGGRAYN